MNAQAIANRHAGRQAGQEYSLFAGQLFGSPERRGTRDRVELVKGKERCCRGVVVAEEHDFRAEADDPVDAIARKRSIPDGVSEIPDGIDRAGRGENCVQCGQIRVNVGND